MKRNILLTTLLASLLFIGCSKDDGPLAKADGISVEEVPFMRITKVAGFTADIIPSTIASYVGKIMIEKHYAYANPNLKDPDKVDLVIIKNGDRNNVKVLRAGITGPYPVEVTFTGPELVALFGSVVTCDAFQVGYDVYANGKKYEAYPPGGAAGIGGATAASQPGFSPFLNYNTKVEYVPSVYSGNFVVVSDEFGDFPVGSTVVITQVNATQFSFIQPAVTNPVPMVFTVDPVTLGVSLQPRQVIGSAFTWPPFYTGPRVAVAVNATTSFVTPCTKTLTLAMDYSVDLGSFGRTFKLVLRKP